jgi:hypothetical protein
MAPGGCRKSHSNAWSGVCRFSCIGAAQRGAARPAGAEAGGAAVIAQLSFSRFVTTSAGVFDIGHGNRAHSAGRGKVDKYLPI